MYKIHYIYYNTYIISIISPIYICNIFFTQFIFYMLNSRYYILCNVYNIYYITYSMIIMSHTVK